MLLIIHTIKSIKIIPLPLGFRFGPLKIILFKILLVSISIPGAFDTSKLEITLYI